MMCCRHCGKRLPLLRKLQDGEFCSDKHRSAYAQNNDMLALARLHEPGAPAPRVPLRRKGAVHQDEAPFGSLVTPRFRLDPADIGSTGVGLFRMHPEDEENRVSPIDGGADLIHPHLPHLVRQTQVPRADTLVEITAGIQDLSRAWEERRVVIDPGFEAELRTPGFEKRGAGQTGGLIGLVGPASRVPLPWEWVPLGGSGLIFLRPDATPYRRQVHSRLPRLNCPLIASETAISGGLAEGASSLQAGPGNVPAAGRLLAGASVLPAPLVMKLKPKNGGIDLLSVLTPAKVTRGMAPARASMPVPAGIDLRPFERVHGNRRPVILVEGEFLGTAVSAYPTMDALLGRRMLAGAPKIALAIPAARSSDGLISALDTGIEEFRGAVALPAAHSIAGPEFRAPLGSIRQLALASRNPLKHRTALQPQVIEEAVAAPAAVTPRYLPGPDYSATPGVSGLAEMAAPEQAAIRGKAATGGFVEEWPEAAPPGVHLKWGAGPAQKQPELSNRLFPISADQICPRSERANPKGEWEPDFTPPVVILSSSRLELRDDMNQAAGIERAVGASLFSGPKNALGAIWQQAGQVPKWATATVMTLLMSVGLMLTVPSAHGTPDSSELSAWGKLQKTIMNRAAIALTDDFRTGLASWEGKGDWARSWSYDSTGFVRTGEMALYTPTLELQDYRVEFLAQIEKKALSWAVRAADLENYQVVKLVLSDSGPVPRAEIVRYAVVDGKRGKETRKPLPMSVTRDTIYRVAIDIRKNDVVLTVQGAVVDTWTEPRLARGGVGFFSAPGEKARLRWVGVWHQYDTLGRLCAYLSPYSMPDRERSMGQ